MGYWGYKATESDGALDELGSWAALIEARWYELKDWTCDPHGEQMALIYMFAQCPQLAQATRTSDELRGQMLKYLDNYLEACRQDSVDGNRADEMVYIMSLEQDLLRRESTGLIDAMVKAVE